MPVPPVSPDPVEVEAVLRRLELTVTRKVAGLLHGDFQGLLPGAGSELGDTRLYEPGDDVRRIDWAATARSGDVQLRTTVEDRELTVYLVVDASGSMEFGSVNTSKRYLGAAAAAVFGFLAARGANRVGGGVLAGGFQWFPPRSGRDTVRALLHAALTGVPGEGLNLADALEQVVGASRARALVVVVSDFADPSGWDAPFRALGVRGQLIAVEVYDPRELALSDVGVVVFEDAETGDQRWVDTRSTAVRERFAAARAASRAEVGELFRACGAGHLELTTGVSADRDDLESLWIQQVMDWLVLRRRAVTLTGAPQ